MGCYEELQHRIRLLQSDDGTYRCVKSEKTFLQGGTNPLDYIYIFKNPGNRHDIPRHWHYIGLGLSDINGYSQFRIIHEELRNRSTDYESKTESLPELFPPGRLNGYGFELTARIKCTSDEEWNLEPPVWPRILLQDLACYVFRTRNVISAGDHVAWHKPLDGDESRIEHMLMTLDAELREIETKTGPVRFIQVVGVCTEELDAAREWNVRGVLGMMAESVDTGGPLLVTDMSRGATIFELDPDKYESLQRQIDMEGSDMVQISNIHKVSYLKPDWFLDQDLIESQADGMDLGYHQEPKANPSFRFDGTDTERDYPERTPSRMSMGSETDLNFENFELREIRYYDRMYILLSHESARVLPVMLKGRLKHNKDFSFQCSRGDSLITFFPENCERGSFVTPDLPIAKHGTWLQIYVPNQLREQMYETIKPDFDVRPYKRPKLPKNYCWPEFKLFIRVVDEIK